MKATCPACQHVQILAGSSHTADEHRFVCSQCGKMGSFKPRRDRSSAMMETLVVDRIATKSPPRPSIPLPGSHAARTTSARQQETVPDTAARKTQRPVSFAKKASEDGKATQPGTRGDKPLASKRSPTSLPPVEQRPKQPAVTSIATLPPERRRVRFDSTRPGATNARRATEETQPNGRTLQQSTAVAPVRITEQPRSRTAGPEPSKRAGPVQVVIKGVSKTPSDVSRPSRSASLPPPRKSLPPPRKSLAPPQKAPKPAPAPLSERSTRRQDTTAKRGPHASSPSIEAHETLDSSGGYKVDTGSWLISTDGQDRRCLSLAQVLEGWSAGQLAPDTQVWRPQEQQWAPILQIPELGDMLVSDDDPTLVAATAFAQIAKQYQKAAQPAAEKPAPVPSLAPLSIRPDDYSFSLAALGGGAAPNGNPRLSDPSGLLTHPSVARMGGVADASLFEPPVKVEPEPHVQAPSPLTKPLFKQALRVVTGLATVGLVAFSTSTLLSRSRGGAPTELDAPRPTAQQATTLGEPLAATTAPKPETATSPTPVATVAVTPAPEVASATPLADATEAAPTTSVPTSPLPSGTARSAVTSQPNPKPITRSAAPKPSPPKAADVPFNKSAAITAMGQAALQAAGCSQPGGPRGSGKLQVTFSNSGRATSAVIVEGPFAGTSVGSCVARAFRSAQVPAFTGEQATVLKAFRVP